MIERFKPHIIVEVQDKTSKQAGYDPKDILIYLGQFGYDFYTIGRKAKLTALSADTLSKFQNVFCIPVR